MEERQPVNEPAENEPADAELKRPEEAIKDLEPDEQAAEDVTGGGSDMFMKLGGIEGESL
jgi:hypothetical protein